MQAEVARRTSGLARVNKKGRTRLRKDLAKKRPFEGQVQVQAILRNETSHFTA